MALGLESQTKSNESSICKGGGTSRDLEQNWSGEQARY